MNILFLCTANSSRSQMAEGWLRALSPGSEVYSAGTAPGRIHPRAVQVMAEVGVDISSQESKGLDEVPEDRVEIVVSLCEDARTCPVPWTGSKRIHWPVDDPAAATGSEGQILQAFRKARDEIKERVGDILEGRG